MRSRVVRRIGRLTTCWTKLYDAAQSSLCTHQAFLLGVYKFDCHAMDRAWQTVLPCHMCLSVHAFLVCKRISHAIPNGRLRLSIVALSILVLCALLSLEASLICVVYITNVVVCTTTHTPRAAPDDSHWHHTVAHSATGTYCLQHRSVKLLTLIWTLNPKIRRSALLLGLRTACINVVGRSEHITLQSLHRLYQTLSVVHAPHLSLSCAVKSDEHVVRICIYTCNVRVLLFCTLSLSTSIITGARHVLCQC
jgi:hypothetical protein